LGFGAASAFGGAGADEIALHIYREKVTVHGPTGTSFGACSTISEASEYCQHQAPAAGAGVGPRFR
jgi:hypothetical protein